MSILYWDPNTLVIPLGGGQVRLFQVPCRRNVLTTTAVLPLIDQLVGGCQREALSAAYHQAGAGLRTADATTFTLWEHAFCNSDFFDRTVTDEQLEPLDFDAWLELLTDCSIVSSCWPPQYDHAKHGFADRFKGSFYEQIGTEALYHRTKPVEWWVKQKFTDDLSEPRATPYRYVEDRFLSRYLPEQLSGQRVLEVGCGTGYYTRKIAQCAERTIGLDYNADYIAAAREQSPRDQFPKLEFVVGDIIDFDNCRAALGASLGSGRFDTVILIDTFLFLFDPSYQSALVEHRGRVIENLRDLLAEDGVLRIMDPHPLWLTPWIGVPGQPIAVLSEYRQRHFKVIPTLEEMTGFLFEHGLRIRRIIEPPVDAEFAAIDPDNYGFLKQFPAWWLYELERGR